MDNKDKQRNPSTSRATGARPTSPRSAPSKARATTSKAASSGGTSSGASGGNGGGGKPPRKKKFSGKAFFFGCMRFIAICICIGIMAGSVGAVFISLYVVEATANDGDLLNLDNLKLSYAATIKVRDSETGAWVDDRRLVQTENREWVNLDVVAKTDLIDAFLAIEDKNFENHMGISINRTILAAANELTEKLTGTYLLGAMQGASTINQQLIKNLTNDDKQDYGRKIREIFRAIALDNKYSKDIILEAYLNTIRLTGNIAGVQAGAHNYFNKRIGEDSLSIAECASIAAVTKDPTEYNPFTNPEKHLKRRNNVIYEMRKQKRITQAEYEQALKEPLRLAEVKTADASGVTTWAQDAVINDVIDGLMEKYGWTREEANSEFHNGGYTVYATYDNKIQTTMEQVMNNRELYPEYRHVTDKKDKGGNVILGEDGKPIKTEIATQASLVIIDYNGEVKGNVGGLGVKDKSRALNRAMDVPRAVGSTMKGVTVYPLAIESDYNWSSTFLDAPYENIKVNGVDTPWPRNYDKKYTEKSLTIEEAVRRSVNTIAVTVGTDCVGVRTMFDFAYDTLQIKSLVPSDNGDIGKAQMCLGSLSYGMTPEELAGAYMMYGNKGEFVSPHTYIAVENSRGEVVLEPEIVRVQAISEDTAYIMNRLLSNVLGPGGTAPGIRPKTSDGVGKTGTTNETRDVWFAGVTPNYVTSGWFGFDENEPMDNFYNPNKHPVATAWRDIMDIIQEGTENTDFAVSENVIRMPYCRESGANPGPLCPEQSVGYYRKGTELGGCTTPGHY